MMDHAKPKIDLIIRIPVILQILLEIKVPDIGSNVDVVVIRIDLDLIAVITIDQRSIGKKPAVKDMIPSERTRRISIIDPKSLTKSQVIAAKITGKIDPVFFTDLVISLYIQVIKIEAVFSDGRVTGQFEKEVGIGTAATDGERAFVLQDWAFRIQPRRDQPDPAAKVIVLIIAIVHFNIHGRRKPAPIFRRHSPLVDGDIFYRIGIKGGEKAQQMRGIIDRCFIQQDQVLIGPAATDIKAAVPIPGKLDPRQQLYRLKHISFPKQHGNISDLTGRQLLNAHHRPADIVILL